MWRTSSKPCYDKFIKIHFVYRNRLLSLIPNTHLNILHSIQKFILQKMYVQKLKVCQTLLLSLLAYSLTSLVNVSMGCVAGPT